MMMLGPAKHQNRRSRRRPSSCRQHILISGHRVQVQVVSIFFFLCFMTKVDRRILPSSLFHNTSTSPRMEAIPRFRASAALARCYMTIPSHPSDILPISPLRSYLEFILTLCIPYSSYFIPHHFRFKCIHTCFQIPFGLLHIPFSCLF